MFRPWTTRPPILRHVTILSAWKMLLPCSTIYRPRQQAANQWSIALLATKVEHYLIVMILILVCLLMRRNARAAWLSLSPWQALEVTRISFSDRRSTLTERCEKTSTDFRISLRKDWRRKVRPKSNWDMSWKIAFQKLKRSIKRVKSL